MRWSSYLVNFRPLLLAWVVVIACACRAGEEQKEVVKPDAAAHSNPNKPMPLFTRNRPAMGTVFMVQVEAPEAKAAPAVQAALEEISRLEALLSEWQAESEISRINQSAGKNPEQVSDAVFQVVKAGVEISRWSEGAFDLSWANLRGLYDFRRGTQKIPSAPEVKARLEYIDWRKISLNEAKKSVFIQKEDMILGTGGIAKGYALDRAGEILRKAGLQNYMLFAGGQVQVHGARNGRAWRVGIQHPREARNYIAALEAKEASFSTSGDYERAFIDAKGQRWHHILDPKTGLPARKTMSATVLAPSGIYADALSTAAFVLGPSAALEMFTTLPFPVDAVLVDAECRVHLTPNAAKKVRFTDAVKDGRLVKCGD